MASFSNSRASRIMRISSSISCSVSRTLLGFTDFAKRSAGVVNPVTMLNIPSWRFGDEEDKTEDDNWNRHLEYDDHPPVPLA